MYSQFTKEFVEIIYLFYNNNVIVIRKKCRVKKSFELFVKHISILSFIVILKEINLFSSYLKSLFENLINHYYYLFS